MRRALLALAWAAAPCAAQSNDAELEIEISGGYRGMQESAGEIFDRLLSAIDDSGGGRSVDSFDVLQGISGEVSTMQVAPDPNAIGVDITADTGLSAVAGSEMHVRAGGKFRGQFGDRATVTMGMLDVESLDGVRCEAPPTRAPPAADYRHRRPRPLVSAQNVVQLTCHLRLLQCHFGGRHRGVDDGRFRDDRLE